MDRRGSDACIEATQVLQNKELPLELLRKLNALRAESVFTDLVLCVGREEIPCHRNILAVSSPYFKAMFTNDLRESREGRISFNELSPKTLRQLVDYVYTGRVEISVDNAQDMLAAASLFHYPEVVNFCCEFLRRHLHPSNCLGIEGFSHLHSCSVLEADAHRYALENFVAVCECEEFLELTVARLLSYISSDLIEVRTERVVFEAMLKWVDHDPERRKSGLCTLMKGIRFSALELDFLQQVVKPNFHITACPACSELVSNAFQFHAATAANDVDNCHQVKDFEPRPSTVPKEVLVIVGSVTCENKLATVVDVYDPRKGRWTSLPELPVGLVEYSVAAVGNDIFVTGGIRDGCTVSTVWRFVSSKRQWCEMPSLVEPRARHASASWNSRLYVIGGVRSPRATSANVEVHTRAIETIECLNMSSTGSSDWAVVGLHPCPRVCSHVIPFKDQLVEVGGTLCGAVVPTMESYHCSVGWIKYSGEQFILPEPIEFSKMAVIDGIFYIVWENSRKMISLNPEKRTFRLLKDMKYTHVKGAASVLDGYIYVVGGATSAGLSRNVERYNPVTNEWETVKSMSQGLLEVQSVAINMC